MNPAKALELVQRYSQLTKQIKDCGRRIGEALDKCRGISGKRLAVDRFGWPTQEVQLDSKNREIDLHLTQWYTPYTCDDGTMQPSIAWHSITLEEHHKECCHCYEAHLNVEKRKAARKALGSVKGAMTRSTP